MPTVTLSVRELFELRQEIAVKLFTYMQYEAQDALSRNEKNALKRLRLLYRKFGGKQ